jgi:hypothetical protein
MYTNVSQSISKYTKGGCVSLYTKYPDLGEVGFLGGYFYI